MKTIILLISIVIGFNCYAMRCGNYLVLENSSVSEVISKCGQPSAVWGNIFGDQGQIIYVRDSTTYTLQVLNNRIVNIDMQVNWQ